MSTILHSIRKVDEAVEMALAPRADADAGDDLDDIFNYDVDANVFQDFQPTVDAAAANVPPTRRAADLGIDEEIKISKKRKPVPKLDDTRCVDRCSWNYS